MNAQFQNLLKSIKHRLSDSKDEVKAEFRND